MNYPGFHGLIPRGGALWTHLASMGNDAGLASDDWSQSSLQTCLGVKIDFPLQKSGKALKTANWNLWRESKKIIIGEKSYSLIKKKRKKKERTRKKEVRKEERKNLHLELACHEGVVRARLVEDREVKVEHRQVENHRHNPQHGTANLNTRFMRILWDLMCQPGTRNYGSFFWLIEIKEIRRIAAKRTAKKRNMRFASRSFHVSLPLRCGASIKSTISLTLSVGA